MVWRPPLHSGSSAITGYTVTAAPGGATVAADACAISTVFGGLTNGTSYTFTVTATNGAGTSPPSKSSAAVTPTAAPPTPEVQRLGGVDDFCGAAAISRSAFAVGVPVVYIANGQWPGSGPIDALAATPVAVRDGAPLLYVAVDAIPAATASELQRLQPGRIVVIGGANAVSAGVESSLAAYTTGGVSRIAGASRDETAYHLAVTFPSGGPVYVVSHDGLSDAPLAGEAAALEHAPVVLVAYDSIPSATSAALNALAPSRIVVTARSQLVSDSVLTQLQAYTSGTVTRVGADDLSPNTTYAQSVALSKHEFPAHADRVFIASDDLPMGLAASVLGANAPGPLLVIPGSCIPPATAKELTRLAPSQLVLIGNLDQVANGAQQTTCRAPVVKSVSPSSGSVDQTVTIGGLRFTDVVDVSFGGVSASSWAGSSTVRYAMVPACSGPVDVTVTTDWGTSRIAPADHFTCS